MVGFELPSVHRRMSQQFNIYNLSNDTI